jgi:hypothetical protein
MVTLDLIWILWCITEGFNDAWYNSINHNRGWLRHFAVGVMVLYASCGVQAPLVLYLNTTLALIGLFLLAFNISYNLSKGEAWHYIGNTAEWDKLMRKLPRSVVWCGYSFLTGLAVAAQLYMPDHLTQGSTLINITWRF